MMIQSQPTYLPLKDDNFYRDKKNGDNFKVMFKPKKQKTLDYDLCPNMKHKLK